MARKARARTERKRAVSPDRIDAAINRAISSAEIIATGVANLVKNTLVTTLSGVRDIRGQVVDAAVSAVRRSIMAVEGIGGDLGNVAKQAVKGTVRAVEEIGGDLGAVVRSASKGAVKAADEVGGDVAAVARKSVEGTIEAAREVGADVAALATDAAEGAIEAADRISSTAGRTVRATLSGTIGGTRVIVQEALQRAPTAPLRGARPRSSSEKEVRDPDHAVTGGRSFPIRSGVLGRWDGAP
jgi:hypothetical protein